METNDIIVQKNILLFNKLKQYNKNSTEYFAIRDELFENNQNLIYVAIRSFNRGNYFDNEDYYSEAAKGLLKAIDSYNLDSGNAFSNYAMACMRNSINSYLRKQNKLKTVSVDYLVESREIDINKLLGSVNIEDSCQLKVMINEIKEYLNCLSEREREVIRLRYLDENNLTQLQISKVLGLKRASIGRIEVRAIGKLKKYLKYDESEG